NGPRRSSITGAPATSVPRSLSASSLHSSPGSTAAKAAHSSGRCDGDAEGSAATSADQPAGTRSSAWTASVNAPPHARARGRLAASRVDASLLAQDDDARLRLGAAAAHVDEVHARL